MLQLLCLKYYDECVFKMLRLCFDCCFSLFLTLPYVHQNSSPSNLSSNLTNQLHGNQTQELAFQRRASLPAWYGQVHTCVCVHDIVSVVTEPALSGPEG